MALPSSVYQNIVWDYNLPQHEFEAILRGEKSVGNLDQSWAIARLMEHADYYTTIQNIPIDFAKKQWDEIKNKLFNPTIRDGYEFVLQRHTLSTAK